MPNDSLPDRMASLIKEGHTKDASVELIEAITTSTQEEMKSSIKAINKQLEADSLPTIDLVEYDASGYIRKAWLNDGIWDDTLLYEQPYMEGKPLKDPSLEKLAQHFQATKYVSGSRHHLVRSSQFLLDQATELDPKDTYEVLKRASDASYVWGDSLNVVFADFNKDGKRKELSDAALMYKPSYPSDAAIERVDLFDPAQKPPEK